MVTVKTELDYIGFHPSCLEHLSEFGVMAWQTEDPAWFQDTLSDLNEEKSTMWLITALSSSLPPP